MDVYLWPVDVQAGFDVWLREPTAIVEFIPSLRPFYSPSRAILLTSPTRVQSFLSPSRSKLFSSPAR